MYKFAALLIGLFSFCTVMFGQSSNEKMLFIIDSIPLLNDPEPWNLIKQEDIADVTVVRNRDSLKLLGWSEMDGIAYVFTREYRNRPDSLRSIPGLKQMEMKSGAWHWHNSLYSGPYIDYYNNGKKQSEGTLLNGRPNGAVTVYFKNGNQKMVSHYKDGALHGAWNEYYPNGALMHTREYANNKVQHYGNTYFINGRVGNETKLRRETPYDTAFTYYSTGRVKKMKLIKNGVPARDKNAGDEGYYSTMFYQHLNAGRIKEANKCLYQLWLMDSSSSDAHFREGLLLYKEMRFDAAVSEFDKAIQLEPLMREALVHRGLARLKKYKYGRATTEKNFQESPLLLEDIVSVPDGEQAKICADFRQASSIDFSGNYVETLVPEAILNHCRQESNR